MYGDTHVCGDARVGDYTVVSGIDEIRPGTKLRNESAKASELGESHYSSWSGKWRIVSAMNSVLTGIIYSAFLI